MEKRPRVSDDDAEQGCMLYSRLRAGAREASTTPERQAASALLLLHRLSFSHSTTLAFVCFLSCCVAAAGNMGPGVDLIVHVSVGLPSEKEVLRCV